MMKFQLFILICSTVKAISCPAFFHPHGDSTRRDIILLDASKVQLQLVAALPKKIKEASGLEITGSQILWTHNDDGIPVLYGLDTLGNLIKTIHLNTLNRGWEDLTQDEEGNLYVGSFGNNNNDKKDLKIYKISNPEEVKVPVVQPEIIQYKYADQKYFPPDATNRNYDADAFVAINKSLYLFSKNRTKPFNGYTKVYKLSQQPGSQLATLVDSLFVGKGAMINHWVTSVDISPDKKTIALLFHDHIWLIRDFEEGKFSKGKIYQVDLKHYSHKAGVCFKTNNKLYIVDELEFDMIGGNLYALDITPILSDVTDQKNQSSVRNKKNK